MLKGVIKRQKERYRDRWGEKQGLNIQKKQLENQVKEKFVRDLQRQNIIKLSEQKEGQEEKVR